ncbi:MAG: IclR family transcriptional regulator [Pseudomonadota bacterium]
MGASGAEGGTVGKALGLLDEIAALGRPVRFAELLAGSDHPKATLYRLLQTLTNQGMLTYAPEDQTYRLGVRLVRLAHAAWRQSSLAPIARPHLDALSARLGLTVHLAQLDGGQVLYVDKRNAAEPIQMFAEAGRVGPGYCTGIGKAMLAHLPDAERAAALSQQSFHRYTPATLPDAGALAAELADIRRDGHAFDREEHEPGIICVAAPILSATGRVHGGLSVTTSTDRATLEAHAAHAPLLKETAAQIAVEADNWRFPDA